MKKIILKSKSITKSLIIAFIVIIALSIFVWSCKKAVDIHQPTQTNVSNVQKPKDNSLEEFLRYYYEKEYELLVENQGGNRNSVKVKALKKEYYSLFATKGEAEKHYQIIDVRGQDNQSINYIYTGFKVKEIKILPETLRKENNTFSLSVTVLSSISTNAKYVDSDEVDVSESIVQHNLKVIQKDGAWHILFEERQPDDFSINESESAIDVTLKKESDSVTSSATGRVLASYSYSGVQAAAFAYENYISVVNLPGYHDYTNQNGDCTNFLSYCLRKSGWPQENNWFFKSDGSSCNNMSQCKRSPSWAGANQFYQYIKSIGQYNNGLGKNRVVQKFEALRVPQPQPVSNPPLTIVNQWNAFYDKVKTLKLGDIVQIGNGGSGSSATIGHCMIVSKVLSSKPFVKLAYRNSNGNNNYQARPINELNGQFLYGFNVKSSGTY